jgi:hypothetical protein
MFKYVCEPYDFRVADLLMQKREDDTPERSKYDTFCTGRGNTLDELAFRTVSLIDALSAAEIHVYRYKIEETIVDSNIEDTYRLIRKE